MQTVKYMHWNDGDAWLGYFLTTGLRAVQSTIYSIIFAIYISICLAKKFHPRNESEK